ncbi:MAG TPA: ribonuclease III [Bdellovibrionales bacterium]|nr:ribonuclease III [Bdellovibrionales bacterium]
MKRLEDAIGYSFAHSRLLEQALTHKSFANEKLGGASSVQSDNERLEFLGDAVLDLALSDLLMTRFQENPEGALSKKRASLVNEESLARIAMDLKLDEVIRLGKGEAKTGGLQKPRILASTLEAILGAVYTDGGFPAARATVERLFDARLEAISSEADFSSDFKTRLQEKMQETRKATPTYTVESETGPDHDKVFEVSVRVDGGMIATGKGRSKKQAEQDAARRALELMQ